MTILDDLPLPDLELLVHQFLRLEPENQRVIAGMVGILADPPSELVGCDPTHEIAGRLGSLAISLRWPRCGCCRR